MQPYPHIGSVVINVLSHRAVILITSTKEQMLLFLLYNLNNRMFCFTTSTLEGMFLLYNFNKRTNVFAAQLQQ
jgi:hypothetical protein